MLARVRVGARTRVGVGVSFRVMAMVTVTIRIRIRLRIRITVTVTVRVMVMVMVPVMVRAWGWLTCCEGGVDERLQDECAVVALDLRPSLQCRHAAQARSQRSPVDDVRGADLEAIRRRHDLDERFSQLGEHLRTGGWVGVGVGASVGVGGWLFVWG